MDQERETGLSEPRPAMMPAVELLGAYDLFAYVGKKVINPGGITGRDRLLESVRIRPGSSVLEIGCGTGHAACDIAKKYRCHVTAVDISPQMIAKAREVVKYRKQESAVTCVVGDITDLKFPENSFDVVLAQAVLMFVDPKTALEQVKKVLRPGGVFGALEFCWKKTPDEDLKNCTYEVCGCNNLDFHHYENWRQFLVSSGLADVHAVPHKFDMLSIRGFIRDEGVVNAARVAGKILSEKASRKRAWEIWKHFAQQIQYYEYAILTGKKARLV